MDEKITFSIDRNNSYIDKLINQCFSILPIYEENGQCIILIRKIDNIFHRLNGFFTINDFDSNITIDVLSLLSNLKTLDTHSDIRGNVLKICALLSQLKVVSE